MDSMRGYTTAIAVSFLVVALGVVGLRWHALSQQANAASPASASARYAYSPPRRGTGESGNAGGTGSTPVNRKGRGVSPSNPPNKPAAPTTDAKPKTYKKSSAKAALPALRSVNLNSALQAQLESLPGIGPALAGRIISYRNEHGPFKAVDGLDDVKGIGPKKLADIEQYCYVD
ncbi:MAG: ComEA family DNA-binding protein [bacterium]|nr:ComEA family DNA-binding protein [bacterium]